MPAARKRKTRAPRTPLRRPPGLEYRARSDGAWYSVRLALQGGSLRVMYEDILEETDEWYDPPAAGGDLASPRDVAALRARFRAASPALQDARCRDLRPGARLCVGCDISGGDLKYYDAVLDSVTEAKHETVDGEERCACRFTVRWTDGPRAGGLEQVGIDKVCCVQATTPVQDPALSQFLDVVTRAVSNDEGNAAAASQESGAALPKAGEGETAHLV